MKKLLFISLLFISFSCKKDPDIKGKNNRMSATINFSNGNIVTIDEMGENVMLGISLLVGPFANVINNQKQEVSISASDYDGNGLIECSGSYYTNYGEANEERWSSNFMPGDTIIFSNISGDHREGTFFLTCVKATDTVHVSGAFNGEFEN